MATERESSSSKGKRCEKNTNGSNHAVVDVEFEKFCQDLALPDEVRNRAWNIYRDFASKDEDIQAGVPKSHWYSATVYAATVDARLPYGPEDPHIDKLKGVSPCVSVTELLCKSHVNIIQFFERMQTLRETIVLSDAVKRCFARLEKRYCIVSPLYHRFVREWNSVYRMEDSTDSNMGGSVPFSQPEGPVVRKTLCWTLFLHTKECLLGESPELIHAYHLLLCCLEYVLRSTPSFQLQQPFDMLRLKSTENLDQNGFNVAVFEKLADQFQTSVEDMYSIQNTTEAFFQNLRHVGGELDLVWLREQCQVRYRKAGDLDELLFLKDDPHLLPDHNKVMMSTPASTEAPVTPVRAALNTLQQLKNILSNSLDEPSAELKQYFKNCSINPTTSIEKRLATMKSKFVVQFEAVAGTNQTTTATQRFTQAVRLYYRVMKVLLDTEKERLSQMDFSNLLNNDAFHRSLLACSVEIVLMSYGVAWNPSRCAMDSEDSKFSFPWILEVFSLYAYDFYKVLESFIKAEPNLTREIIKHLTVIENRILDKEAWKADSPLFDAIAKSEVISSMSPSKDLTNGHSSSSSLSSVTPSSSSAADLYLSPMKPQRGKSQSQGCVILTSPRKQNPNIVVVCAKDQSPSENRTEGFTSPSKQGGGVAVVYKQDPESPGKPTSVIYTRNGAQSDAKSPTPKRSQSLNMFFNKVCKLGYHRLKTLCDMLQVPKVLQQKIWTCLEFCITCRSDLLKNRHLDQIMMCSLYGICKVSDSEIKFKDIVGAYRAQPHAEPQVFKQALIEGEEYDSIISFYNRVFMQAMKTFILQFAKPVQPNLSPVPRPVTSPLSMSPVYTIPGRRNFYVSPLRESPFKAPHSPSQMTPRTKQLYSFGEGIGSSEKLKNINESIKLRNNHSTTPRSLKRLSFDGPDDASQNSPTGAEMEPTIIIKKKKIELSSPVKRTVESAKEDTEPSVASSAQQDVANSR